MSDKIEYGIKIIYKNGNKDTKWYSSEYQRDLNIIPHKQNNLIKSAKPYERRKRA